MRISNCINLIVKKWCVYVSFCKSLVYLDTPQSNDKLYEYLIYMIDVVDNNLFTPKQVYNYRMSKILYQVK